MYFEVCRCQKRIRREAKKTKSSSNKFARQKSGGALKKCFDKFTFFCLSKFEFQPIRKQCFEKKKLTSQQNTSSVRKWEIKLLKQKKIQLQVIWKTFQYGNATLFLKVKHTKGSFNNYLLQYSILTALCNYNNL